MVMANYSMLTGANQSTLGTNGKYNQMKKLSSQWVTIYSLQIVVYASNAASQ